MNIALLLGVGLFIGVWFQPVAAQEAKLGSHISELASFLKKNDIWIGSPLKRNCPKGFKLNMASVKYPKEMFGCSAIDPTNEVSLLTFDTKGGNKIVKINFDLNKGKTKCDSSYGSKITGDTNLKPTPNGAVPGFMFFFKVNSVETMVTCPNDNDPILGTFWVK